MTARLWWLPIARDWVVLLACIVLIVAAFVHGFRGDYSHASFLLLCVLLADAKLGVGR